MQNFCLTKKREQAFFEEFLQARKKLGSACLEVADCVPESVRVHARKPQGASSAMLGACLSVTKFIHDDDECVPEALQVRSIAAGREHQQMIGKSTQNEPVQISTPSPPALTLFLVGRAWRAAGRDNISK